FTLHLKVYFLLTFPSIVIQLLIICLSICYRKEEREKEVVTNQQAIVLFMGETRTTLLAGKINIGREGESSCFDRMLCASILQRVDDQTDHNQRLSLSSTELMSLSEEISKLLQQKDENAQHEQLINDLENRVDLLNNKVNTSKERHQSELEYLNMALENRTDELQQVQEKHDEKEASLKQIKRQLQRQETEIDQKDTTIKHYEKEIVEFKEEVERLNRRLKTLKGEKEKHTKGIEIEEKQNRIVKFNDDVAVKVFEVEDHTEALQKDMSRLQKENEKLKRKLDELKWQMKAKDIMISNGEDTMQALENQAEEIEMLQDRVEELEEKLRLQSSGEQPIDNPEVDILKMKVREVEMKLKQRDETIRSMKENKKTEESAVFVEERIVEKVMASEPKMIIEERVVEKVVVKTELLAPQEPIVVVEPNPREEEYLKMLITLRDTFYSELQLKPQQHVQNGKGHFEVVFEDLQTVLGSIRQKVSKVLEESVVENNKEIQRVQSLKKQNTSLKEEIQTKTENYNNTVKSLEIKNEALSNSVSIQQQFNDELSEKCTVAEKERDDINDRMKELSLKMLVRDSEVDRLKNILDDLKKSKKLKKLMKKDKKKSNSLSNLLKA
uniref:Uncharacterized protein n=2 Tax=Clytia hemisphaerica TaxID=252671 RepID=A0A7M5V5E3_9CNID